MSHAFTAKQKFKDFELLKKAFEALGATLVQNGKLTKTWSSDPARGSKFDWIARFPDTTYDVGIQFKNGEYQLVADFVMGGLPQKLGQDQGLVKQAYNYASVKRYAAREGYRVHLKQVGKEQKIQLVKL